MKKERKYQSVIFFRQNVTRGSVTYTKEANEQTDLHTSSTYMHTQRKRREIRILDYKYTSTSINKRDRQNKQTHTHAHTKI